MASAVRSTRPEARVVFNQPPCRRLKLDKARGAGVVATAMFWRYSGKAIRLRIFFDPSGTYAQDNEQAPMSLCDLQAIQRVPLNAESDFTACGSDTSNTTVTKTYRLIIPLGTFIAFYG